MSTQQYPQLPGPGGGPPPAPLEYAPYPVSYGPPGPAATVPPVPPGPRSTAFWVGVSTAITLAVVGALLIGFFIGRGSRLSNDAVQGKIVQQSQSDQIAEQQALDHQSAVLQAREAHAVAAARHSAYSAGRQAGYTAGQQAGFVNGQTQGYQQGVTTGTAQGETTGFSLGLNQGACFANTVFCSGG
jgi:hypothetical protein